MGYDANGNLIRKVERATQHSFQNIWDEENRLACHHEDVAAPLPQDPTSCDEIDEDPKVRFTYDDAGNRLIKDSDTERFYINQYFTVKASDQHKHVFIGTSRVVTKLAKPDAGFEDIQFYFHPDHLGSTSLITDREGFLAEHLGYFPFGETWVQEHPVQPIAFQFTGKELDSETGLYYFGARYYDPRTSVWQSGDPMLEQYVPKPRDKRYLTTRLTFHKMPQWKFAIDLPGLGGVFNTFNLNLYSYTYQNPLRFIDPDGRAVYYLGLKSKVDPTTRTYLAKLDKATPGVDYYVTSGIRSEKENRQVGGSRASHHLKSVSGTAVDVNPAIPKKASLKLKDIAGIAKEVGFTGVIAYPYETKMSKNPHGGRLHLDRRTGKPFFAEASRNKKGKTIYLPRDFTRPPDVKEGATDSGKVPPDTSRIRPLLNN